MTLDGLDCFEFFKFFCFPNKLFFLASISHAIHSIDICTVKKKNIRNMHAVLTNQIIDIWYFNGNWKYQDRSVSLVNMSRLASDPLIILGTLLSQVFSKI